MISMILRHLSAYMGNKQINDGLGKNLPGGNLTGSRGLVQAAAKEQEQIGWDHFFAGRMSRKWQEALVSYHQAREKLDPTAKLTPISSLIRTIWEARLTLWRRSNEMKHGKTFEEREEN